MTGRNVALRYFSKTKPIDDTHLWTNKNNIKFCENLSYISHKTLLKKSGIDDNIDIHQIKDVILNSNSIVDVGSGYGRVLEAIHDMGFKGSLTGIESAFKLAKFTHENLPYANIIKADWLEVDPNTIKADSILMMWSTISVFFIEEQKACFNKAAKILNSGGKFILDIVTSALDEAGLTPFNNKFYSININGLSVMGYHPSLPELIQYASNSGLKLNETRSYKTKNNIERSILIFKKP